MAIDKEVWEKAKALFELGKSLTYISDETGINKSSISKKAKAESWEKGVVVSNGNVKRNYRNEPKDTGGFVYVIYFDDTSGKRFFKIGIARDYNNRLGGHQSSLPFKINTAICYFCENMREEEKILHEFYKEFNIRGEWFDLNKHQLIEIKERALRLKDG